MVKVAELTFVTRAEWVTSGADEERSTMVQHVWVVPLGAIWTLKTDARQVITAYETEAEAIDAARAFLSGSGGGELTVKRAGGEVALRESVLPSTP
jgi:hypothetical protein